MTNALKTTVLLALLTGLLMWVGQMLGGAQGLVVGLVIAAVMNLGSYWFSGWLANLFSTHPPVEERVRRLRSTGY